MTKKIFENDRFNLVIYNDGNRWVCRLGDIPIEGLTGYGNTIPEAVRDFADNSEMKTFRVLETMRPSEREPGRIQLHISPQVIVELVINALADPRCTAPILSAAKAVKCLWNRLGGRLEIEVESDIFDMVPDGERVPTWTPQIVGARGEVKKTWSVCGEGPSKSDS